MNQDFFTIQIKARFQRILIVINDLFHVDLLMVTLQQPIKGPKIFTLERQIVVTMKGIQLGLTNVNCNYEITYENILS